MFHVILALWASYIVMGYFEQDDYHRITKAMCVSAIIVSSIGLLQVFGLDIFGKVGRYNHQNHMSCFLDNPNLVGGYLSLCLPYFLLKENKKYIFGLALSIIAIILSKSEMAVICMFIGLITYLLLVFRKRIVYYSVFFAGIVAYLIAIFNLDKINKLMSWRWDIWSTGLTHIKNNPIFGQGLGIVKAFDMKINYTRCIELHNDWLEIVAQLGVLGLVLILALAINSIRKFNYNKNNRLGFCYLSSFVTFLFLMLGAFPMEIAPLALSGLVGFWGTENL